MTDSNVMIGMLGWAEVIIMLAAVGLFVTVTVAVVLLVITLVRRSASSTAPLVSPAAPRPPVPPPAFTPPAPSPNAPGTFAPGPPGEARATWSGAAVVPSGAEGETRCPRCGGTRVPGAADGMCPKCLMEIGLGTQPSSPTEAFKGPPPDPATLEREFPNLEVAELLGQGGMGIVYRARQKSLDRWVALKLLPRSASSDPAFAERFQREARALARLTHPSIVGVYEFGDTPSFFFLLMEYVEGSDLRRVLRERRMSPVDALRIVPAICEALQYAHANGVVHRDIKPANILIDREGRVKIADFGIAKLMGGEAENHVTLTQARQSVGTPHYMAPEQVESPGSVDHRADIYSLGVVFYEMLTGELPLGHFQPPSRKVEVDVRFDEVVLRSLEKEPGRRYQKVSEVKSEVERISADPPGPGRRTPAPAAAPSASTTASTSEAGAVARGWDPRLTWAAAWAALFGLYVVVVSVFARSGGQSAGPLGVFGLLFFLMALAGAMAPLGVVWLSTGALRGGLDGRLRRWGVRAALVGAVAFPVLLAVTLLVPFWGIAFRTFVGAMDQLFTVAVVLTVITAVPMIVWAVRCLRGWVRASDAVARRRLGVALWTSRVLGGAGACLAVFVLILNTPRMAPSHILSQEAVGTYVPEIPDGVPGSLGFDRGLGWVMTPKGPVLAPEAVPFLGQSPDVDPGLALNTALQSVFARYKEALAGGMTRETNALGHVVLRFPEMGATLERLENEFWTAADALLGEDQQAALRATLRLRGRWERKGGGTSFETAQALLPIGDWPFSLEYWKMGSWHHFQGKSAIGPSFEGRAPALPTVVRLLLELSSEPVAVPAPSAE